MSLILSCLKNNSHTAGASEGQAGALILVPGLPHHYLVGHETVSWIRSSAVWGPSREPSWLLFSSLSTLQTLRTSLTTATYSSSVMTQRQYRELDFVDWCQ